MSMETVNDLLKSPAKKKKKKVNPVNMMGAMQRRMQQTGRQSFLPNPAAPVGPQRQRTPITSGTSRPAPEIMGRRLRRRKSNTATARRKFF